MLCLLAEIYARFPEQGDSGNPKLVIFLDEAHLIFKEASRSLLQQLETIIKFIRCKGVGIFFCTQAPTDIPDVILSQLGTKIQHALRAFTAKDRKDIKLVAENFPITEYYQTDSLITELGIGEALVTVLNEKGIPTPLVHTLMCAPESRMGVITPVEQDEAVAVSSLATEYNEVIDRKSAYEILNRKMEADQEETVSETKTQTRNEPEISAGIGETLKKIAGSGMAKTIVREVTRGLFGILIGKSVVRRTTKRRTGW